MTWLRVFASRALDLVLGRRRDHRLAEEIQTHLDLLTNDYIAAGLSREDARLAARRAFGGVDRMKTIFREQRGLLILNNLAQELRFAVRVLAKDRRFTLTVVLVLALGIGANTAIFSLIESLVLRPLPVKNPGQLVILADSSDTNRRARSSAVWQAIWHRRAMFDSVMAWTTARFNLAQGGETQLVNGIWASASLFETLGVPAMLGRTYTPEDDVRGGGPGGPVTVISYSFWQRSFGGTADVIGRTITLGGVPYTIIGVTPPTFFGVDVGRSFDVLVPTGTEPLLMGQDTALGSRATRWLNIMARLKAGQTLDDAIAAIRGVQPQIREETMPEDMSPSNIAAYLKDPLTLVPSSTGASALRSRYERPLFTILVVVVLVLLIACANVANLTLARAAARRHEWSVRLAMGASRSRLVRQLLAESLLLSTAGALVGVLMAQWASRLLVRELSTVTNRVFLDLTIDWRVLLFTIAATVITALLFGTAPALRAAGTSPIEAIKEHGRGAAGTPRLTVTHALVVVQVALSVVLVVGAGLFIRTFSSLANRDLGFDTDPILLADVNARQTTLDRRQRLTAYGQLRERVMAVPGVAAAAVSFEVPLASGGWENRVTVSNSVALADAERWSSSNAITPGWFATFGVPILAGRDVSDRDQASSAPVIVVNEAFARRFFNGASPLGQTVAIQYGATIMPPREIVGLVGDMVSYSPREHAPPTMYVPLAQFTTPSEAIPPGVDVVVRASTGSPALLARGVGAAIAEVNRDFAVTFRPFADQVSASFTQDRVVAMLAGFFGALALMLAAIGLYGVTSYAVTRRRSEIAVRMALGAAPRTVVGLVLSRVSGLVSLGVVAGIVLSVWASQFVASLLFSLTPRDPITIAGAALVLVVVGLLAGWLPARRASRLDPVIALRD